MAQNHTNKINKILSMEKYPDIQKTAYNIASNQMTNIKIRVVFKILYFGFSTIFLSRIREPMPTECI